MQHLKDYQSFINEGLDRGDVLELIRLGLVDDPEESVREYIENNYSMISEMFIGIKLDPAETKLVIRLGDDLNYELAWTITRDFDLETMTSPDVGIVVEVDFTQGDLRFEVRVKDPDFGIDDREAITLQSEQLQIVENPGFAADLVGLLNSILTDGPIQRDIHWTACYTLIHQIYARRLGK